MINNKLVQELIMNYNKKRIKANKTLMEWKKTNKRIIF